MIQLESAARLAALRDKADAVTGESSATLAGAVDALIAGFGAGGGADSGLLAAVIARTVTEIDDDTITTVGPYAFRNCSALSRVNLPNATTIGSSAFMYCSSLTKIVFPSVQGDGYKGDGNGMFTGCTKLKIIDFHSKVDFPYYAFYRASALTALVLRSLDPCTMAEVSLSGTAANVFGENIANGTGYIYVPAALMDTYKAATNWSVAAAQFRALEDYTVDGTITGELDESKI